MATSGAGVIGSMRVTTLGAGVGRVGDLGPEVGQGKCS